MITTVAEIGINHNGNLDNAIKMIRIAAVAGFDYVKFQVRNPDLCVPENQKEEMVSSVFGRMPYIEYKHKMEFSTEQFVQVDECCRLNKIKWFCSVFDIDSAKKMASLTDMVKIPSAIITDLALLDYCRETYKFRIMSTGMSTEKQIEQAVSVFRPQVIMHTTSCYPCKVEDLNLQYVRWLKEKYKGRIIGYSGHEEGLDTTYAVISYGAEWIERHITLDHKMQGRDHLASVEPIGMFKLIKAIRDIEKAIKSGYCERSILECEQDNIRRLRRQ